MALFSYKIKFLAKQRYKTQTRGSSELMNVKRAKLERQREVSENISSICWIYLNRLHDSDMSQSQRSWVVTGLSSRGPLLPKDQFVIASKPQVEH